MCRQKIYIQLVYFSYDLKDFPEKEDFHSTVYSFQKTFHEIENGFTMTISMHNILLIPQ
jgi:hypothetical protein